MSAKQPLSDIINAYFLRFLAVNSKVVTNKREDEAVVI